MVEKIPILLVTIVSLLVSVTVSAETINQFGFRYRTETKIGVSVVHYVPDRLGADRGPIHCVVALPTSMWPRRLEE